MKKSFVLPLGVYPYDLLFLVGYTHEQTIKEVQKHLPKELSDLEKKALKLGGNGGMRFLSYHRALIILLKDFENTPYWAAVVAHEAFHAASALCEDIGIELCCQSEEAYAYITQFIVHRALQVLLKRKKKKK
jgi:hypothetical protein